MISTVQVQKPVLPVYTQESAACRNRTLTILHIIAQITQNSDDIHNRIGRYLFCHPCWKPSYKLSIERHGKDSSDIELFPGDFVIAGRSRRSNLMDDDRLVSGTHSVFSIDIRGRLTIMDLASLNGTFVNNLRIQPLKSIPVEPGFGITTGETRYRVSRNWNRSVETQQIRLSVNITTNNGKKCGVRYHRCLVTHRRNSSSFEVYVCLEKFAEMIIEYFGLAVEQDARLFCADQLLSEMEYRFIESIIKCITRDIAEWYKIEYRSCEKNLPGKLMCCELTVLSNGKQYGIGFLIDPDGFSTFSSLNQFGRLLDTDTGLPGTISNLQVRFICFSRHLVLKKSQFEKVRIGDVLFPGLNMSETFDEHALSQRVYLVVAGGCEPVPIVTCDCCLNEESVLLKIHSIYREKESMMQQMNRDTTDREKVTAMCETRFLDISNEPLVEVKIEIGRLHVSIAELCQLHPGTLLRIKRAIDEPVSILIDDRVVGTGRLVQIHEEYGVEVVTWKEE
jgi:flagellar motor switch/type III secretory pathway protein FliN